VSDSKIVAVTLAVTAKAIHLQRLTSKSDSSESKKNEKNCVLQYTVSFG
jgi:hypothetical protein